jgi:hypothetical protein
MLLIVDGGQFVRFVVNVICEDFVNKQRNWKWGKYKYVFYDNI